MATAMLQLKLNPEEASIEGVAKILNISASDIDKRFGVIEIAPKENLYVILVESNLALRLKDHPNARGVFGNPSIGPANGSKKRRNPGFGI